MFISDIEELLKIIDQRDQKIIALVEKTIKNAMGKDSKFITTKEVAFELNIIKLRRKVR
jgi:hypothetical protein|tara:strand:+ start:494 stop:670 length:177 start_codon:yes stop_codon:yes gene_type:complete